VPAIALIALMGALVVGRIVQTTPLEPETRAALVAAATRFNADYARNRPTLVYARFDAASRRVITEAEYVRRHRECPNPPGTATTEGAAPVGDGDWRVRYVIDGVALADYWHYVAGRWRFDLVRSNPDAVRLYREPFAAYRVDVGCG
jgi:hypothetical protein